MKLKFTLIFFCFNLAIISSYGQLQVGDIAPDFTLTDINGEEHNLYDLLDEGKTVFLDIMATWCEPCWEFHNDGMLKTLWEEHGPDGADDLYIFMIEGDVTTPLEALSGVGQNTLGNWIEDTPYPIIDSPDQNFTRDYEIIGYPETYLICPDKRIIDNSNFVFLSAPIVVDLIDTCPGFTGSLNAAVFSYTDQEATDCGSFTFAPEFSFQNLGGTEMTSSQIELRIDGSVVQSLEWTGALSTFQVEEVIFDPITLTANTVLEFEIISINGMPDELTSDNIFSTEVQVPSVTLSDSLIVEFQTDEYAGESYWAILDDLGNVISEGGNLLVGLDVRFTVSGEDFPPADGTEYQPNTIHKTTVAIPANGCYSFVVTDYYEDGICCDFGDGYFKLKESDGTEIVSSIDKEFLYRLDTPFAREGSVSIDDIELSANVSLLGNPINDVLRFNLSLENNEDVQFMISNATGQILYQSSTRNYSSGQNHLEVDVTSYAEGIYSLTVFMGESIKTTSFIKN